MASISKFHASLFKPTQETTFALANANFDFSLVKIEPREEYRPVGNALSRLRRDAGETGSHHTTARRLGSIFKSLLPPTPNLIKAYGERASAISQSPEANPKGTKEHGPFQDYVGLDGSTVWAAATSGDEAIVVHLLACMLALQFPPSECMAIWTELVAERQRELADSVTKQMFSIEDAAASKLEIAPEQLQEWDMSARAWLKAAADAPVVKDRQRRLMEALRGPQLPVKSSSNVYESVINAWKLSLETMENIVSGAAYSIQDGSVLLALASWHLYPDLVVFGPQKRELRQCDGLIQEGGIVTIGLLLPHMYPNPAPGVTWSLSLSNLRYYGQPVHISRSLAVDDHLLTFDDFMVVALGAIIRLWSDKLPVTRDKAMEVMMAVADKLEEIIDEHCSKSVAQMILAKSWIRPVKVAVSRYTNCQKDNKSIEKSRVLQPLKFGARQPGFMRTAYRPGPPQIPGPTTGYEPSPIPVPRPYNPVLQGKGYQTIEYPVDPNYQLFGLCSTKLVGILRDDEAQVSFLRNMVEKIRSSSSTRYPVYFILAPKSSERPNGLVCSGSPLPFVGSGSERKHCRWIQVSDGSSLEKEDELIFHCDATGGFQAELRGFISKRSMAVDAVWAAPPPFITDLLHSRGISRRSYERSEKRRRGVVMPNTQQKLPKTTIRAFGLELVAGTVSGIGLYAPTEGYTDNRLQNEHLFLPTAFQVAEILRTQDIDPVRFVEILHWSGFIQPMRLISTLWSVYRHLPNTKISPRILTTFNMHVRLPFSAHWSAILTGDEFDLPWQVEHWDYEMSGQLCRHPSLATTFSIIHWFETGTLSVSYLQLSRVFAMSSGDSLYIADRVLTDPGNPPYLAGIRHVRGHIGRPGVGFLVEPFQPAVRKSDPEAWKLVNHQEFDGTCSLENCFSTVSLHLRLTGYELALGTQAGGTRFADATVLEAVVSAHSDGRWIADLSLDWIDPPTARHMTKPLPSPPPRRNRLMPAVGQVVRRPDCKQQLGVCSKPDIDLVAIEHWEELLDPPMVPGVFKAHGNWEARLAAVCISLQLGFHPVIFADHGCWDCALRYLSDYYSSRSRRRKLEAPGRSRPPPVYSGSASNAESRSASPTPTEFSTQLTSDPLGTGTGEDTATAGQAARKSSSGSVSSTSRDETTLSNWKDGDTGSTDQVLREDGPDQAPDDAASSGEASSASTRSSISSAAREPDQVWGPQGELHRADVGIRKDKRNELVSQDHVIFIL